MILSDAHRFAFVHVPKCAGSSMKSKLSAIDDTAGMFRQIGDHPQMGPIHFSHLTLHDLATYFPGDYARLVAYRSMAIIRHPTDRFVSAIFQRLREFKKYPQSHITPPVFEQEVEEVIAYLRSQPGRLSLPYIHFNRQSDFVFNDGERIVRDLFTIDKLDRAVEHIRQVTGIAIDVNARDNVTTMLRFAWLLPVVRVVRGPYAALFPHAFREALRARLTRLGLYRNPFDGREALLSPGATAFLADYYRRDYALYEGLREEDRAAADAA